MPDLLRDSSVDLKIKMSTHEGILWLFKVCIDNMNLHCYVILGQSCLVLLQRYSICHQLLTKVCFSSRFSGTEALLN